MSVANFPSPTVIDRRYNWTAAINRAKDSGDLDTLRQIASDPHGFILRQGWAGERARLACCRPRPRGRHGAAWLQASRA